MTIGKSYPKEVAMKSQWLAHMWGMFLLSCSFVLVLCFPCFCVFAPSPSSEQRLYFCFVYSLRSEAPEKRTQRSTEQIEIGGGCSFPHFLRPIKSSKQLSEKPMYMHQFHMRTHKHICACMHMFIYTLMHRFWEHFGAKPCQNHGGSLKN